MKKKKIQRPTFSLQQRGWDMWLILSYKSVSPISEKECILITHSLFPYQQLLYTIGWESHFSDLFHKQHVLDFSGLFQIQQATPFLAHLEYLIHKFLYLPLIVCTILPEFFFGGGNRIFPKTEWFIFLHPKNGSISTCFKWLLRRLNEIMTLKWLAHCQACKCSMT